ncbi:RNA pol II accessory factor [Aphelenchoides avenae]|nr:RNA pol II accessory factor [Aphelenchus avenae]
MSDPLKLLQEHTTGRRPMRELISNGKLYYAFGDFAFPHDAGTNVQVYSKPDEYYSLEAIIYLWKSRNEQHTAYVKDVSGKGIQAVTRMQRTDLLNYLKGEKETAPDVNLLAPIPPPIPVSRLVDTTAEPQSKRPRLDHEDKGQRIDKILDQSLDTANDTQLRGLSSELPASKVMDLRTKMKKNRKHVVKSIGDDGMGVEGEVSLEMPDASADSIGKYLVTKERLWKDRTTCLESHSKDFSNVIAVLHNLKMKDSQSGRARAPAPAANGPSSAQRRSTASNVQSGYSRYDQEQFQTQIDPDFQIDTGLSFHGMMLRQVEPCLPCTILGTNFLNGPGAIGGRSLIPQRPDVKPALAGRNTNAPSTPAPRTPSVVPATPTTPNRPQKRVSTTPIIIIPASGSSLITMHNVSEILQDLRFVSTEEKKAAGCRRDNEVIIQRRKNGGTVPYRVIDSPLKLRDDEWDRVVAVFVQGPAWQFKGWKWDGNPTEIFAHIAAFHLKFEEQKLDPNVAKLSVQVLSLSKTKRHLDKAILHKFWQMLDKHIGKNKPHLRF